MKVKLRTEDADAVLKGKQMSRLFADEFWRLCGKLYKKEGFVNNVDIVIKTPGGKDWVVEVRP